MRVQIVYFPIRGSLRHAVHCILPAPVFSLCRPPPSLLSNRESYKVRLTSASIAITIGLPIRAQKAKGRARPMSDEQPLDKTRPITLAEAAEIYGFNHRFLAELARKGRLKARKSGGVWLTTPADVEDYIASRQKRGAYRNDIQT